MRRELAKRTRAEFMGVRVYSAREAGWNRNLIQYAGVLARYTEPFTLLIAQLAYEGDRGPELAYRFEWMGTAVS